MELIPKEGDRIICVKIGKVMRENLYEMTRKYWVMKLERASKATHVLAIIDGIVEQYISQMNGNILMILTMREGANL